ncbi:hypothetical protein QBC37DRAFT_114071 [Rhypophila decipiens]|uniref:LYC1 C-terminal domain-containing protein n=1 Tax=Rhypophila decipiens TaxID=261697 RepID=A0AAN6XTY2_9PEZI|nr:hypothetical protein QBC37DRAFT_114071 [Rhypophila decipiens]
MADSESETATQKFKLNPAAVIFGEATAKQREIISTMGGSPQPPLTPEEYLMSQKTLSRPGTKVYEDIRYFCLFHKDETEMLISACEVHHRQAVVSDTSGASPDVITVNAYAIASVYTPPQFRGQGMASFMLQRLQELVDQGGYEVGVLYSAIGGDFYGRLGWAAFDRRELVISLDVGQPEDDDDAVHLLSETEMPPLCERDCQLLSSKLEILAKAHDQNEPSHTVRHVSLLPTYEQMAFHMLRDTYMAEVLYTCRGLPRPDMYHGAITRDKRSWLYWDHGLPSPAYNVKLRILRIVTDPGDEAEKMVRDVELLLKAAVGEAARSGLEKVVVWEPDEVTVTAAMGVWDKEKDTADGQGQGNSKRVITNVVVEDRKDDDWSLPCLRWRGDDGGNKGRLTVWVDNQAFGWC